MALGKASMQIAEEILGYLYEESRMPQNSKAVEYIKDAMAGAVLIAAIIALVVTVLIFLPYMGKLVI